MKVVIDIPENDYKLACNYPDALIACYAHYIKAGVPLRPICNELAKDTNVPCKDTISRQAAIDAFMTATSDGDKAEWCKWVLERLSSAQPEPQWIPCSERLPDMPIRVLVQFDNGWIITAYRQDNEWFSLPDFGEAIKDKWVEAWMPLPEPYRVERRTDE